MCHLWNSPKASFINFKWNDNSCKILYLKTHSFSLSTSHGLSCMRTHIIKNKTRCRFWHSYMATKETYTPTKHFAKLIAWQPDRRHCVFYGVEYWIGFLEWNIGVEWRQKVFGVAHGLALPQPTVNPHKKLWLGHMLCNILWWKEQENLPLQKFTPLLPILHSKIGLTALINDYNFGFD